MDLERIIDAHLANHGVDGAIAAMVEGWTSPCDPGEEPRVNLTIGYRDGDVRRETTMSSLPSLEAAKEALADRSWVATFLSLGIRAMPASKRPDAPDWIIRDGGAERVRSSMARARDLAADAVDGERRHDEPQGDDAPF